METWGLLRHPARDKSTQFVVFLIPQVNIGDARERIPTPLERRCARWIGSFHADQLNMPSSDTFENG
jgi:hypothetical protein